MKLLIWLLLQILFWLLLQSLSYQLRFGFLLRFLDFSSSFPPLPLPIFHPLLSLGSSPKVVIKGSTPTDIIRHRFDNFDPIVTTSRFPSKFTKFSKKFIDRLSDI
jgi:hypothetical protein